jgi:hypothetical protein
LSSFAGELPGGLRKAHLMMFMVVETFHNQDAKAIYRRLREKGRMMPDGLKFVSSWVAADLSRCFQRWKRTTSRCCNAG